ncbi:DNA mismatch endonuclease Vsr [Alteromonas sp. NFXS44]|uniref:very short patch repair endonuclease n=1 Tax=Alteromonas sp. NFXS44 TaxID=2818435 RepID=UPI0032DEBB7B
MADVHDKTTRSKNMSAIKSRNTKPELLVRRALFARGYRYRKNVKRLPGSPDIVLPKYRTCIFVHGCFWHMHEQCHLAHLPETRTAFWLTKLTQNTVRDKRHQHYLLSQGWKVIIVWECALKGVGKLPFEEVISRLEKLIHMKHGLKRALEIR